MNFIRMFSPLVPPPHILLKGELEVIRERILQTLLLVIALASIIGLVGLAIVNIPMQQYGDLLRYVFFTLIVLVFTGFRRLPYTIRSLTIILALLVTSVVAFGQDGLQGNGKLYLFTFTTLTTILLGWRAGTVVLVLSELGLVVSAYLFVNLLIPVPAGSALLDNISWASWTDVIIFYGILASVVTFTLGMTLAGLESSYFRVNRLSKDLAQERSSLQVKVDQRTEEIQYRLRQVLTASEISKTIVTFRETEQLLPKIVNLISERFNLYYVGVFIVDENNDAVLRAGTGVPGEKMLAAGHHLPVGGTSMIGWSIANRQPRIALDVGAEAVRFNNPYLPNTRSELALPILSRDIGLGALTVQSVEPNAFDENDIQVFQGVADSLAIALENALLYEQTQASLEEVRILNREYLQQAWTQVTNEYADLSYTFENQDITLSSPANIIQIPLSLRDQVIGQITLETADPSLAPDQMELIDAITAQTSLALENARLLDETQHRAIQEQTLNQLTSEFSRAFSVEDILKSALRQLSTLPAVNDISVHLVAPRVEPDLKFQPAGNALPKGNGKENN
jgi:GAF domain-containing protein